MAETMKAWFAVPGAEGAVFELRETPTRTMSASGSSRAAAPSS